MSAFASLTQSTIGKKVVMATTGLIMVGFVTIHMLGNTLVFMGPESFNHYAEWIQSGFGVEPALLWVFRLVMLAAIGGHIWAAVGLSARNRAARPEAYAAARRNRKTSYAAQFMLLGGIVITLFLLFHLAHLTLGVFSNDAIQAKEFVKGDAYRNLVVGLSNPLVAGLYIVANLALGAHLRHGVWSGMQTLGLNDPKYDSLKSGLGTVLPIVVAGGNIVIATAIVLGLVAPPA